MGPFRAGDREIPADLLNRVTELLRQNVTATGDLVVQRRGSGLHFSLSDRFLSRIPERRNVLVTRREPGNLIVREVAYGNVLPRECEGEGENQECFYDWASGEFPAYPDFGRKLAEYELHTGPITGASLFAKAYKHNLTWRVEKPAAGGGTNLKVVRAMLIVPENPELVLVELQEPKVNAETGAYLGWGPQQTETGQPITMDVFVWPGLDDIDYRPMILAGTKPFAKIEQYGGLWFLRQLWPWRVRTPTPAGLPSGRCNPL